MSGHPGIVRCLPLLVPPALSNTGNCLAATPAIPRLTHNKEKETRMAKLKRQLFATVSLAIITLSLGAFGQLGIEDSEGTAAPELEGSWRVMVTLVGPGGPMPPFLTFSTFGRGGTFLESTQPGQRAPRG